MSCIAVTLPSCLHNDVLSDARSHSFPLCVCVCARVQVSVVEPKDETPIAEPYSEQKGAKPFDQQQQQQMI